MRRITQSDPVSREELRQLVPGRFRDMIKGVVDLRRRVLVIDAEIARVREVVVDFFDGPDQYRSTAADLQRYFDADALAARP